MVDKQEPRRIGCRTAVQLSKVLSAVVAAVALIIGCDGVGTPAPADTAPADSAPADTAPADSAPADSIKGSLALSRGGDYNVTADWRLSGTCGRSPQLHATAAGSPADSLDLTGTSGSETLGEVHYRNAAVTVELRCGDDTLATDAIDAPVGTLKLARGTGNTLEAAWTLEPRCSAGEIAATPADGSAGDSHPVSGTGGDVEFTAGKLRTQGASGTLDCNDARMAAATIAAPATTGTGGGPPAVPAPSNPVTTPITGTVALSRGSGNSVVADWTFSRVCSEGFGGHLQLHAHTDVGSDDAAIGLPEETSGTYEYGKGVFTTLAVMAFLRCGDADTLLATAMIAAP